MPFFFLMTPNQMLDNDYRLPSYLVPGDEVTIPGYPLAEWPMAVRQCLGEMGDEETATNALKSTTNGHDEWFETPAASSPPEKFSVLAIDCEMVRAMF